MNDTINTVENDAAVIKSVRTERTYLYLNFSLSTLFYVAFCLGCMNAFAKSLDVVSSVTVLLKLFVTTLYTLTNTNAEKLMAFDESEVIFSIITIVMIIVFLVRYIKTTIEFARAFKHFQSPYNLESRLQQSNASIRRFLRQILAGSILYFAITLMSDKLHLRLFGLCLMILGVLYIAYDIYICEKKRKHSSKSVFTYLTFRYICGMAVIAAIILVFISAFDLNLVFFNFKLLFKVAPSFTYNILYLMDVLTDILAFSICILVFTITYRTIFISLGEDYLHIRYSYIVAVSLSSVMIIPKLVALLMRLPSSFITTDDTVYIFKIIINLLGDIVPQIVLLLLSIAGIMNFRFVERFSLTEKPEPENEKADETTDTITVNTESAKDSHITPALDNVAELLNKYAKLYQDGVLTEIEFTEIKNKILADGLLSAKTKAPADVPADKRLEKFKEAKELYEKGIISRDEYDAIRYNLGII